MLCFQAGDIDFTYVSSDVAQSMEGDAAYQVFRPLLRGELPGLHARHPQWQDENVRKAFLYGIDRQAIVDDLQGFRRSCALRRPVQHLLAGRRRDLCLRSGHGQAVAGRRRLRHVGREYEAPTYYTGQLANDVMQAFQAYLSEIGVKTTPRFMEPAAGAPSSRATSL